MRKALLVLAFILASSFSTFAQEQNFTLVNGCDFIITHVYISPASSDNWGEDVLTLDVLGTDEEFDITFEGYEDCGWDIKAIAEDESSAVWTNIDLCEYFTITLTMTEEGPVALME